jgi:hypothetical protein
MARAEIRAYRSEDRDVVRRLCADTGFLGQPIDPVFEDRELFADYLTGYYLCLEPDATLVCEVDGAVMGYLMGCRRPILNQTYQVIANLWVGVRAIYRCAMGAYGASSREFMRWIAFNAWREVPAAPRFTPHFHINLLPPARSVKNTRLLIQSFLEFLQRSGHKRVYGQMVTYESRRTDQLFERYGFSVTHRTEITKFRRSYPGRVFLATLVKDLSAGPVLAVTRRYSDDANDREC